jgi:hypothetical protein
MWVNGQWNSFGNTETPKGGRLQPKHVVRGRSDRSSCILDGIMLCIYIGFISQCTICMKSNAIYHPDIYVFLLPN